MEHIIVSGSDLNEAENSAKELARQGTLELIDVLRIVERLNQAGRTKAAIDMYSLWIDHTTSPLSYVAHFNVGVLLAADGDYPKAAQMNRKALELNPDLLQARLNLGTYQEKLGNIDETLELWRSVLTHKSIGLAENKPLQLHALNNLGRLLESRRDFRESLRMLEKSLELEPDQVDVLLHMGHLRQKQCIWPLNMIRKAKSKEESVRGCSPLAMLSASDDPELQLAAATWFVGHKFSAETRRLAPAGGYRHKKIRVGYLSSDFCLHAVSLLTVELFELHDRERFEIYGFCWSREDGSPLRARVIKAMDHFIKIGDMSDQEAAECIRKNEIDVLIDLQGLTSGARPLILSFRPASVQMTYLGFVGTTGLPWIDHVIADKYLIPEESAQFFTEKPLYLPNCFQVSDGQRPVGPMPTRAGNELPEQAFVFCSFNNNYKFTEELFAVWMKILKKVPGSVLWLLADNEWARKNLCQAAKRHGIKKDRLIFASRVAPPDYLARYQLADLFLDTFPFNGGTTANDALFMGLPLLTLSGRTLASRMAGSLLTNLGLPELIATSLNEYEDKAVRLAKRPAEMESVRKKLSGRKSNIIFDMPALTREIEELFRQALELREVAEAAPERADQEAGEPTRQQPDDRGAQTPAYSVAGNEFKLPKLTPIHPTVVKNFHSQVNWGVSDPEKFAQLMAEAAKLVMPGYYLGDNLFTWGRNNSMFEDTAFVESWQKNNLNTTDQAIAWRRYLLACSACNCLQLEGDFVECGVYQGTAIKTVIDYFGVGNFDRDFWGFDTFDYTPVPGHLFEGQGEGTFERIQQRFAGYSRVKLVAGLLPASLEHNSPDKISYLHIDLNSAEYEIAVLDQLFDRVVAGGIVILDDYEWAGMYRQQKVLEDAWFEKRGYRVFPLPTGQGLVLKR
jgi:predicted O-linked N-acetylglucosamine transferase (SPINDLY family)